MAHILKIVIDFLVFAGSLRLAEYLFDFDFHTPISFIPYLFEVIMGSTIGFILELLSIPPEVGIYYKYGSLFWTKMAIAEKSTGITFFQMTKRKHGDEAGPGLYVIMFVFSPVMLFFFFFVSILYLFTKISKSFDYQVRQGYSDPEEYKMLIHVSRVFNSEMLHVLIAVVLDRAVWEAWRWATTAA